jgi:hypothetical protein
VSNLYTPYLWANHNYRQVVETLINELEPLLRRMPWRVCCSSGSWAPAPTSSMAAVRASWPRRRQPHPPLTNLSLVRFISSRTVPYQAMRIRDVYPGSEYFPFRIRIFPSRSRISIKEFEYFKPVLRIRIHRIHMFWGLQDPDPDPLVRVMDPDPDPSINMQKW